MTVADAEITIFNQAIDPLEIAVSGFLNMGDIEQNKNTLLIGKRKTLIEILHDHIAKIGCGGVINILAAGLDMGSTIDMIGTPVQMVQFGGQVGLAKAIPEDN